MMCNNRLLECMAAYLEFNSIDLRHRLQALAPSTKNNFTMLSLQFRQFAHNFTMHILQLRQFAHNFITIKATEVETMAATLVESTVSATLNVRPLNQQVQILATLASQLVLLSDLVDLALLAAVVLHIVLLSALEAVLVAAVVSHLVHLLDQAVVFHLALLSALRALALVAAVVFHFVHLLDQAAAAAEAEGQLPKSGSLRPPGRQEHQAALLFVSGSGCSQAGAA